MCTKKIFLKWEIYRKKEIKGEGEGLYMELIGSFDYLECYVTLTGAFCKY